VAIDIQDVTLRAYGRGAWELCRVQIHAHCRLWRVMVEGERAVDDTAMRRVGDAKALPTAVSLPKAQLARALMPRQRKVPAGGSAAKHLRRREELVAAAAARRVKQTSESPRQRSPRQRAGDSALSSRGGGALTARPVLKAAPPRAAPKSSTLGSLLSRRGVTKGGHRQGGGLSRLTGRTGSARLPPPSPMRARRDTTTPDTDQAAEQAAAAKGQAKPPRVAEVHRRLGRASAPRPKGAARSARLRADTAAVTGQRLQIQTLTLGQLPPIGGPGTTLRHASVPRGHALVAQLLARAALARGTS